MIAGVNRARFRTRTRVPGVYLSAFQKLAARITWVGTSALPATNVATGSRDSAMVGGSGRGVNEVDSLIVSDIPMLGCLASDADAPTDLGVGYGVDVVRCSPSWPAVGEVVQWVKFYGSGTIAGFGQNMYTWSTPAEFIGYWRDTIGNPRYTGSGTTPEASLSSEDAGRGNLLFTTYAYDGVNITGQYQDEPAVSELEADKPSGDLYIANKQNGANPGHCAIVTGIYPGKLTPAERERLRIGGASRFDVDLN